jgi:hypothetical protein
MLEWQANNELERYSWTRLGVNSGKPTIPEFEKLTEKGKEISHLGYPISGLERNRVTEFPLQPNPNVFPVTLFSTHLQLILGAPLL